MDTSQLHAPGSLVALEVGRHPRHLSHRTIAEPLGAGCPSVAITSAAARASCNVRLGRKLLAMSLYVRPDLSQLRLGWCLWIVLVLVRAFWVCRVGH